MVYIYLEKDEVDECGDEVTHKLAVGILCPVCDEPLKATETPRTLTGGHDKLYLSLSNFIRHFTNSHFTVGKSAEKGKRAFHQQSAGNIDKSHCMKASRKIASQILKKSKNSTSISRVPKANSNKNLRQSKINIDDDSDESDASYEDFTVTKIYSNGSSEEETEIRRCKGLNNRRNYESGSSNTSQGIEPNCADTARNKILNEMVPLSKLKKIGKDVVDI